MVSSMAPKRPKRLRDPNQWAKRMVDLAIGTFILASLIAAVPASVLAEAKVEGNPDAVRVEARDATVDEVLSAIGTAFNLTLSGVGGAGPANYRYLRGLIAARYLACSRRLRFYRQKLTRKY
jgi:hypothetical protein